MIAVKMDQENKRVDVTITGFIKMNDAVKVSSELKNTLMKFPPGEATLLIDMVGFAPASVDVFPVLRGMGRDVIGFFKKTALVQEFSMQFTGGRKAIEPPPGYTLKTFMTRDEAEKYLGE